MAARFRQISSQFDLLDNETRQAVETDVGQANSLTNQLAQLNKQLSKHSHVDDQPSELLDQRDLLLRKLSEIMSIKTKFSENGSVLVSVGDTIDQGILVSDSNARAITVSRSAAEPSKLEFLIDAYGKPESLPGMPSGHIGGLVNFREQVLAPAASALDNLASVVTREVNSVHKSGIDAEGKIGGDLFAFEPGQNGKASGMRMILSDAVRVAAAGQFRVIDNPLNSGTGLARVSYAPAQYQGPTGLEGNLNLAQAPQLGELSTRLNSTQPYSSLGLIPVGTQNLTLTLKTPAAGQTLQVLTRDGRHIIGTPLNANQQGWMVSSSNGLENGATYSAKDINVKSSYMGMDIFMGAKASVAEIQQFDSQPARSH